MPDWAMQLLIAGGGLAAIVTAISKLFDALMKAWKAKEDHVDRLQEKVESLLHDAVAREREANAHMHEQSEIDADHKEVTVANTAALAKAVLLIERLEKKLSQ